PFGRTPLGARPRGPETMAREPRVASAGARRRVALGRWSRRVVYVPLDPLRRPGGVPDGAGGPWLGTAGRAAHVVQGLVLRDVVRETTLCAAADSPSAGHRGF